MASLVPVQALLSQLSTCNMLAVIEGLGTRARLTQAKNRPLVPFSDGCQQSVVWQWDYVTVCVHMRTQLENGVLRATVCCEWHMTSSSEDAMYHWNCTPRYTFYTTVSTLTVLKLRLHGTLYFQLRSTNLESKLIDVILCLLKLTNSKFWESSTVHCP